MFCINNLIKFLFIRDELVGKICKALYSYNSQTQDELSFLENETLTIIEGCDKDWVKAQNDRCKFFIKLN